MKFIKIISVCALMSLSSCGYITSFFSDEPVQEEINLIEYRCKDAVDSSLPPVKPQPKGVANA